MLRLVETQETVLSTEDLAILQKFQGIAKAKKRVGDETYEFVDSEVLANSVASGLDKAGYTYDVRIVTGASGASTKHLIEFTLTNLELFRDQEDHGQARIIIVNSYNGECCLTVLAGMIRFACANGLISGEKEFFEKIKHRQGVTVREKLDELDDKILVAIEYLKTTFVNRVNQMKAIETTFVEDARVVLSLKLPDVISVEVLRRRHPDNFSDQRSADRERNVWTLFNVINEVIREKKRHDLNEFEHNVSLLNNVMELAA